MVAAALGAIAGAPEGPVVVTCHAGKDRTGVVVALALSLVGATPESIAADYAIRTDRLRRWFDRELAAVDDDAEHQHLDEELSTRPETILATLDHLDDRYGGVGSYLRLGGLTSSAADALRDRLVD